MPTTASKVSSRDLCSVWIDRIRYCKTSLPLLAVSRGVPGHYSPSLRQLPSCGLAAGAAHLSNHQALRCDGRRRSPLPAVEQLYVARDEFEYRGARYTAPPDRLPRAHGGRPPRRELRAARGIGVHTAFLYILTPRSREATARVRHSVASPRPRARVVPARRARRRASHVHYIRPGHTWSRAYD